MITPKILEEIDAKMSLATAFINECATLAKKENFHCSEIFSRDYEFSRMFADDDDDDGSLDLNAEATRLYSLSSEEEYDDFRDNGYNNKKAFADAIRAFGRNSSSMSC